MMSRKLQFVVLVLAGLACVGNASQESLRGAIEGHLTGSIYEQKGGNVRCDDKDKITPGGWISLGGMHRCKEACDDRDDCAYFTIWERLNNKNEKYFYECQLFSDCEILDNPAGWALGSQVYKKGSEKFQGPELGDGEGPHLYEKCADKNLGKGGCKGKRCTFCGSKGMCCKMGVTFGDCDGTIGGHDYYRCVFAKNEFLGAPETWSNLPAILNKDQSCKGKDAALHKKGHGCELTKRCPFCGSKAYCLIANPEEKGPHLHVEYKCVLPVATWTQFKVENGKNMVIHEDDRLGPSGGTLVPQEAFDNIYDYLKRDGKLYE